MSETVSLKLPISIRAFAVIGFALDDAFEDCVIAEPTGDECAITIGDHKGHEETFFIHDGEGEIPPDELLRRHGCMRSWPSAVQTCESEKLPVNRRCWNCQARSMNA